MKNTFGQSVTLTIFGESHGPAVGVVLDGLTPGLPVDEDFIRRQLSRRRPAQPWIQLGRKRTTIKYSAASIAGAPPALQSPL